MDAPKKGQVTADTLFRASLMFIMGGGTLAGYILIEHGVCWQFVAASAMASIVAGIVVSVDALVKEPDNAE